MRYERILRAVAAEPWAMQPEKLTAMLEFLCAQAAGEKFSADEIEARITKQRATEISKTQGNVALLPLQGVISNRVNMMSAISGGTSNEMFGAALQGAVRSPDVKAIVLDVDSPGGTVGGTDELSQMIFDARGSKPIVAHVNATAASAAYWIASAADEIVATSSSEVGSIGVFTVHEDVSKMLSDLGVTETLIKAGKFKAEGVPFEPLGEDAKAYIQSRVDAFYGMFVKAVARNRGDSLTSVREGYGQGRMVGAQDALDMNMIDSIGTLEDTLSRFGASQYGAPPAKRKAFAIQRETRALELNTI